jgi:hypothetical protein
MTWNSSTGGMFGRGFWLPFMRYDSVEKLLKCPHPHNVIRVLLAVIH